MNLTKLLTLGTLTLVLGACASQPTEVAKSSAEPQRSCVRETGTRIEREKDDCKGPGRTYTREDIDHSGAMTTGEAVRRAVVR